MITVNLQSITKTYWYGDKDFITAWYNYNSV